MTIIKKTMMWNLYIIVVLAVHGIYSTSAIAAAKPTDSFENFIQTVLNHHESLSIAKLNIDRTRSEILVVDSSLGWNLFANAGVNRNRSFIGAESTQSTLALGVNKLLKSGDTIELQGNYTRDDSEFIIINSQPNPLSTTGIDLNYRMPLLQNQLNKRYLLDYNSANSKLTESINTQLIIRDLIILQAIDLYYGSASLKETLKTAQHSISRARKLKEHIRKNIDIGLLEKGEVLQPNAQIRNLQGKYQELKLVWEQNEIAINRLIGKSWNTAFTPVVDKTSIKSYDSDAISSNVNKYNPELKSLKLNLKLADSVIALQQDNTESKLDVVFSIGTLATQGPSQVGSVDDRDVVGGVRLEYQQALDKRGLNSKLYQSQIDKENIKIQISKLEKDLEYETYSLISNINRITKVNVRYKQRHDLEVEKYKDIINRYQAGRTTTNIVIQFDNERTQAELDYKTQKILLEKTIAILKLKQGGFHINKEYK